jgi:hypothetical protein
VRPFAYLVFDGERLSSDPHAAGRRMRVDPRCLTGTPAGRTLAHVCALPDREAALRFDEPEVQRVRRDALEWWIPLLGERLVCLSTFALDASRCAGAVTVVREDSPFGDDPFARLFPGTIVETEIFSEVPPPPGPAIERYAGAPWPGGSF